MPTPIAMLAWFAMWAMYLSIMNVGQTFYAFGWESLLCETGFLAIFFGNTQLAPPIPIVYLLRWLAFRVEFGAGLIKMRGDRCWRDLTCLYYHHETQPMANPLSWYFHHLPKSFHRFEVLGNHFAQLVAPIFLFAPPAHELLVRPLPHRGDVRRVRQRHEGARRGRRRGHDRCRHPPDDRVARVRVQGEAHGRHAPPAAVRALSSAPRLVHVVRGDV